MQTVNLKGWKLPSHGDIALIKLKKKLYREFGFIVPMPPVILGYPAETEKSLIDKETFHGGFLTGWRKMDQSGRIFYFLKTSHSTQEKQSHGLLFWYPGDIFMGTGEPLEEELPLPKIQWKALIFQNMALETQNERWWSSVSWKIREGRPVTHTSEYQQNR